MRLISNFLKSYNLTRSREFENSSVILLAHFLCDMALRRLLRENTVLPAVRHSLIILEQFLNIPIS